MKIYLKTLVLLIVILMSTQCKDKSPHAAELDKLFDEVMTIHDDVMPKTAVIHRLKKKLKGDVDEDNIAAITSSIKQLELADDGMMDWMADFKKPKGNVEFEDAKAYLQGEKEKITKVKKDILSAISVAEELLPKS